MLHGLFLASNVTGQPAANTQALASKAPNASFAKTLSQTLSSQQGAPTIREDLEEWRTAWQGLTPQNQATLLKAWNNAVEAVKGLTPAQKQQIKAAAQQVGQMLQTLTPAQKAALKQQLQKTAQAYVALTAGQKQQILTAMANVIDKIGTLSPARKAQLEAVYQKLLGSLPPETASIGTPAN